MSPGRARQSSRENPRKRSAPRETGTRALPSNRVPRSVPNRPSRRDKEKALPRRGGGLLFLGNGGAAGIAPAAAGQREADRRALRRFEALRPVVLDDNAVEREAAIDDRQVQDRKSTSLNSSHI